MLNKRSQIKNRLDRGRRSPSIYSRTEQQKVERSFGWFYYLILFLFAGGLLYVVLFSPLLKIKKITISGTKYINQNDILSDVKTVEGSSIINQNLLTFLSSSLTKKVGERHGVESVKIIKKWPNELAVEITETDIALTWATSGKKFMVDEEGRITEEYKDKFKDFPTVTDTKNVPATIGSQIVSKDFTTFIKDLTKNFQSSTGAKITKIEVPEIVSEIKVSTDKSWYVLFDTTRTAKGQLISLQRVLNEVSAKKTRLEYVDLRIDDRIFYK